MTPQPPSLTPIQQAQQALTDFEQSNVAGVWPSLDKKQVVAQMRSRIDDPFQVNQGAQPFCGPASIAFELVRKQPLRYVHICRSLFETGSFAGYTQSITASNRLRQSRGKLRMPQADWMLLATLRESDNLILPVEPNAPELLRNLAGITKPWEMKGWLREILGYPQTKYSFNYIFGEFKALDEATNVIAAGGVAFALISAEGLLENKASLLPVPNHWITLLGNISIQKGRLWQRDSNHVNFDVYSWAKKIHVDAEGGHLQDYFWGVVMGRMAANNTTK